MRRGQLLAIVVDQRLLLEARAGAAGVGRAARHRRTCAGRPGAGTSSLRARHVRKGASDAAEAESRAADAQLNAARPGRCRQRPCRAGPRHGARGRRVTRLPIPKGAVVMPGDIVVAVSTGARVLRMELPGVRRAFYAGTGDPPHRGERPCTAHPRVFARSIRAIQGGRVMVDLDAVDFAGDFIGARVRVLVPTGKRSAYVIPEGYLLTRYGVDYARLLHDGRVVEVPVQRGARTSSEENLDGIEILSGLRDGDRIVLAESRS